MISLPESYHRSLSEIKKAARLLRTSSLSERNKVLSEIADQISIERTFLLAANQKDLDALPPNTAASFRDRLLLNSDRIDQIIESLKQVEAEPDPLLSVPNSKVLPNGLKLSKVPSPLGVIFMIFESRPNVAVEALSLALKSGNAIILRGGKESQNTCSAFYKIFSDALNSTTLSPYSFLGITEPDRKIIELLLKEKQFIDVVVPRGGDKLIEFVVEHSRIPIIKNDRGMCHIYVHEDADVEMAIAIIDNAKTQRPGVCNATETILIHKKIAPTILPKLYDRLEKKGVEWHVCPESFKILQNKSNVLPAKDSNWDTEYLDLKLNCKIIPDLDEATAHIEQHGSKHSEAIITASEKAAQVFQSQVDAAAVYWNASTRFTDGFQFGLGGELGISTQKLHVRGPVGLKELTSLRWLITGSGQTR